MNYYAIRTHISNSDLSALRDRLQLIEKSANIRQIYDFGNLIDALITEPERIDPVYQNVMLADDTWASFTDAQWLQAQNMRVAALAHPTVRLLIRNMDFQHIVLEDEFLIDCDFARFTLPAKMKADGLNRPSDTGMDLKSTACTSDKQFRESLEYFDYDRQGAWYMDLAKLKRLWFVGIGKKANKNGVHPVFLHAISRGDKLYEQGRRKYQRLAFMYKTLIYNLYN